VLRDPRSQRGGTSFPIENLPLWAQKTAALLPLTNLVDLSRAFTNGRIDASLLPGVGYLAAFASIAFPLAFRKMRRRLIK